MNAYFDQALQFTLRWEGGYASHPEDPGGNTNFGITQATYDRWLNDNGEYTRSSHVQSITREEVEAIYKELYWFRGRCDQMPTGVSMVHFDACVHHGIGQAARFLQKILGVKVDGAIGPKTLAALSLINTGRGHRVLCNGLISERERFFYMLSARHITGTSPFLNGWLNRTAALREEAG